ncbi:MAG TPA: tripartite tricarboxylate transporter TctB family protein [Alphaproteobacteria bacterium]|nr:tripartite tricarboxylate transporter TctB family protein [Alphaproteobacteria bacterium]
MEAIVALILMALGALVIWDSVRLGWRWGLEGPQAGYFPFRIGVLIILSSVVTLAVALFRRRGEASTFVHRHELMLVLRVLVPTVVFIVLIGFIGIYFAMALFIGFFMWWHGRFSAVKFLPVAVLVPLILFLLFELWFLIPLPKGPVEEWLGF